MCRGASELSIHQDASGQYIAYKAVKSSTHLPCVNITHNCYHNFTSRLLYGIFPVSQRCMYELTSCTFWCNIIFEIFYRKHAPFIKITLYYSIIYTMGDDITLCSYTICTSLYLSTHGYLLCFQMSEVLISPIIIKIVHVLYSVWLKCN